MKNRRFSRIIALLVAAVICVTACSQNVEQDPQKTEPVAKNKVEKVMFELNDYDVIISADVFGITTKKNGDFENIGQDFYEISKIVDVVCPMVYPSHYGPGEYGVPAPDKEPYKIIYASLNDALKQYSNHSGDKKLATIRPYLQDFTASWLKKGNYILYDTKAVTYHLITCCYLCCIIIKAAF